MYFLNAEKKLPWIYQWASSVSTKIRFLKVNSLVNKFSYLPSRSLSSCSSLSSDQGYNSTLKSSNWQQKLIMNFKKSRTLNSTWGQHTYFCTLGVWAKWTLYYKEWSHFQSGHSHYCRYSWLQVCYLCRHLTYYWV